MCCFPSPSLLGHSSRRLQSHSIVTTQKIPTILCCIHFEHITKGSSSDKMAATADLTAEYPAGTSPTITSTHILRLPNEVLSTVVAQCDSTDLKNLRLTCKVIHKVSTPPFSYQNFSHRRCLFTYKSMKALVDITAHPIFGP